MKTLTKYIAALSAFLFASLASASVYQIEVIAFSHVNSRSVNQEQWQSANQPPSFSDALSLNNQNANNYYQALSPAQFLMQREQAEFNRNPEYRTILHTAWLQPFTGGTSPTIHLTGDGGPYSINGTIRISLDRYFNTSFNLYFAAPENALARYDTHNSFHQSDNLVYFHIQEKRRMKSHELNYIDFPLFGVLIKIIPVEQKL